MNIRVMEDKQSLFNSCLEYDHSTYFSIFALSFADTPSVLQVHLKNPASGTVSPAPSGAAVASAAAAASGAAVASSSLSGDQVWTVKDDQAA